MWSRCRRHTLSALGWMRSQDDFRTAFGRGAAATALSRIEPGTLVLFVDEFAHGCRQAVAGCAWATWGQKPR